MTKQLPSINRPEAADMVELASGIQKVKWIPDTRFPQCGTFIVHLEDHTFGTLIRSRLLRDERVSFVGYRVPHPLENKLELRVRTKTDGPFLVVLNAISTVKSQISQLRKVYSTVLRNEANANQKKVISYY